MTAALAIRGRRRRNRKPWLCKDAPSKWVDPWEWPELARHECMVSEMLIASKFPTHWLNLGGTTGEHLVIYKDYDGMWTASTDLQNYIGAEIAPHPNKAVLLSEIAHAHQRKVNTGDDT